MDYSIWGDLLDHGGLNNVPDIYQTSAKILIFFDK